MTQAPSTLPSPRKSHPLRFCFLSLVLALVLVASASLDERTVPWLGRTFLVPALQARGLQMDETALSGTIWEPIVFHDLVVTSKTFDGTLLLTIPRAEATLSSLDWILFRNPNTFLRSLILDIPSLKMETAPGNSTSKVWMESLSRFSGSSEFNPVSLLPPYIQISGGNIQIGNASDLVTATGIFLEAPGLVICSLSPGRFHAPFVNLEAGVEWRNESFLFTNLAFDRNVAIRALNIDLPKATDGTYEMVFDGTAFGGKVRGTWRAAPGKNRDVHYLSGSARQISIPQVAAFLSITSESSGTVDDLQFSFEGNPGNPSNASAFVRVTASDLVLGNRACDNLALQVLLQSRRLSIQNLSLGQDVNHLDAEGEIPIPGGLGDLLDPNISLTVNAKIRDLDKLATLLNPWLPRLTGALDLRGSVERKNKKVTGQIELKGANVAFHEVTMDSLRATVGLQGDEIHFGELELLHGTDRIAGDVTFDLGVTRQYSGWLEISVAEIQDYVPWMPESWKTRKPGGQVTGKWSGDGSLTKHSGAFDFSIKNARFGELDNRETGIAADSQGSYSPESVYFRKLGIERNGVRAEGSVYLGNDLLDVNGLRILQEGKLRGEGEFSLPVLARQALRKAALGEWLSTTVSACSGWLRVRDLPLESLKSYLGVEFPVYGTASLDLDLSGVLESPIITAKAILSKPVVALADPQITGDEIRFSLAQNKEGATSEGTAFLSGKSRVDWTAQLPVLIHRDAMKMGGFIAPKSGTGTLKAKSVSVAPFAVLFRETTGVEGEVSGELGIGIKEGKAMLTGPLNFTKGTWKARENLKFSDVSATVKFVTDKVVVEKSEFDLAAGHWKATGEIRWAKGLDLDLQTSGSQVHLDAGKAFEGRAGVKLGIQGPPAAAHVSGEINWTSATAGAPLDFQETVGGENETVRSASAPFSCNMEPLRSWRLDFKMPLGLPLDREMTGIPKGTGGQWYLRGTGAQPLFEIRTVSQPSPPVTSPASPPSPSPTEGKTPPVPEPGEVPPV